MVLFNYLAAFGAAALTVVGLLAYRFAGFTFAFPAALLVMTAGPLAVAFWIAATWWKRRWPHARVVQLLPFLVILGWVALILLSPVQPSSPPQLEQP